MKIEEKSKDHFLIYLDELKKRIGINCIYNVSKLKVYIFNLENAIFSSTIFQYKTVSIIFFVLKKNTILKKFIRKIILLPSHVFNN